MNPVSSSSSAAAVARTRRRAQLQPGKTATIVGFLLPSALLYTALVLLPIVQAIYYGFYKWNGLGPLQNFIGLGNYARILHDAVFMRALSHNLLSSCCRC